MKKMQCEACGSTSIKKVDDSVFECQSCGAQYSKEEVQKLLVELTGTVKIDHTDDIENTLKRAEQFENAGNIKKAEEYYNKALDMDADNEKAQQKVKNINDERSKPDFIVPFSISERELKEKFINVLADTDYVPTDIFDKVGFDYIKGYYLPCYKIVTEYKANYNASVGYDRKEQYEDYETVYENGRSYKKKVIKERTVTDWHPISGEKSGRVTLWASAVRNRNENSAYSLELKYSDNAELEAAYLDIVKSGSTSSIKFDEKYLNGYDTVPITKDVKTAWDDCSEEYKEIVDSEIENSISGDHVKDISWSAKSNVIQTNSYYIPVWVISYVYAGSHYTFIANGGDVNTHFLSKPQDDSSIVKAKRFYLPLKIFGCICAALIIVMLFSAIESEHELKEIAQGLFFPALGATVVSWIFGFFGKQSYLNKQKTKRVAEKEKIMSNVDNFFSRGADYHTIEQTEGAGASDINQEDAPLTALIDVKRDKPSKESLNKNNKKKIIATSIVAAVILIAVIVILPLTKNSFTDDVYNDSTDIPGFTDDEGQENQGNNDSHQSSDNITNDNGTSIQNTVSTSSFKDSDELGGTTSFESGNSVHNSTSISVNNTSSTTKMSNSTTSSTTKTSNSTTSSTAKPSSTTQTTSKSTVAEDPCADGHTWKEITETIHHEEEGHYEWVVVKEAYQWCKCPVCGEKFEKESADNIKNYYEHFDSTHADGIEKFLRDEYNRGTVQAEQEEKWVVDKEAYDETVVVGYKCEVCEKEK